jgi:ketosteroid isomerase-like protein
MEPRAHSRLWRRFLPRARHAWAPVAVLVLVFTSVPTASGRGEGETLMSVQTSSATEDRNRSLVEEKFAAWGAGTGSPYDLLADDVSWTIVGRSDAAKTYPSREAFLSEVIRPFNARMREGLKPTIRSLIADGDSVVIFFDASGVASDDQPYRNTYAWFWEMADGRVVRAHAFFDSIEFNDLWRRVTPTDSGPR